MSTTVASVDDLERLAARRVPNLFYDYVRGGSWSEVTLADNLAAFERLRLHPRVAVDIDSRTTASRLLGLPVALPVALAPAGLAGMVHANGEILAAQAAEAIGVPFTLSTMSICSIEDVAQHTRSPFWFQLYLMRDRDFVSRLIARARDAGCSALMLTLDLQVMGRRYKDVRNGLSVPPRLGVRTLIDMVTCPVWCARMLATPRRSFGNIVGHVSDLDTAADIATWNARQFDGSMTWDDVAWVREQWEGPLILKGIMHADDARQATSIGADALVVSNHGGRQLDSAPASMSALPPVLDAVGGLVEVHVDGGVRSGLDVLKAVALGAQGVHVGRPWLYGLGAAGRVGVESMLELLRRDLDTGLALCGVPDIKEVGTDVFADASPPYTAPASTATLPRWNPTTRSRAGAPSRSSRTRMPAKPR